jgi:hypothetical protein
MHSDTDSSQDSTRDVITYESDDAIRSTLHERSVPSTLRLTANDAISMISAQSSDTSQKVSLIHNLTSFLYSYEEQAGSTAMHEYRAGIQFPDLLLGRESVVSFKNRGYMRINQRFLKVM